MPDSIERRENLQERLTGILSLAPDHPDGIRLRKRYGGLIDNLFLFLEDAAIPATNNSSEQAIRMSVIFRRVTNGFRSEWGRDLESCRLFSCQYWQASGFNCLSIYSTSSLY